MSTRRIHRPARSTRPLPEPAEQVIEPPPNLPEGKTGSPITQLLPMAGVLGSVVMMTVMRGSQFAVIGALVLVTALLGGAALVFSQRGKAQRTRRLQRERYLEYLEELRHELGAEDRERREAARLLHPPPEALYDIVDDTARLWERRRHDSDFLQVRIGTGAMPVRVLSLQAQSGSVLTPPDRFMRNEAAGLRERFGATPDMPLTVPLDRVGDISVIGTRDEVLRIARTLVVQAAATHAPDDAAFALACPAERAADWAWFKWLPHALDPDRWDGPVPARRIAPDLSELSRESADDLGRRAAFAAELRRGLARRDALDLVQRLLVVHDGHGREATELPRPDAAVPLGDMGVTVLHLLADRTHEPDHVAVRITLGGPDGDTVCVEDLRGAEPMCTEGSFDEVTAAGAEGLARMIAPLRLSPESAAADAPLSGPVDFCAQLGIEDAALIDPEHLWTPRRGTQGFLRVPIGLDGDHAPVLLDLKESAELGMGPHGLCVGATGSGKSELLRTLVLALVATHSPEDLALVLVDYKGGATFAPFASLPHVAGVITNLENKAGLVERVHASLAGEVQRRQQVLKDAGNVADISTYAALRAERPDLAPLPHLFVVIDEFGELLAAKPDFIDLFLSVGRIGRSIGIHLLLSSQRIEGGRLKGLDTYLSYRLGLRTFSPEESRTVLDTADAFHLPPIPGFGYLKVDTSIYQRFKASYVSGRPTGPERRKTPRDERPAVLPYPAYNTLQEPEPDDAPRQRVPTRRAAGPTLLSTVVGQLTNAAPPVPRIWLPPLPAHLPLDAVDRITAGRRGMQFAHRASGRGGSADAMRVPLGLLDDPARQWQGRWEVELTRAGGHMAVIGGPQTGKTTLLRTLVLSLALTHTPEEVAVYGLDLVGGGLQSLSRLPHVGGIAGRTDRERASRTVEEVRGMLTARQDAFRAHGIDSIEHLRRLRAEGRLPALGPPDIVLVIDGFGGLREDFEKLDEAVGDLLKHGGGYGIHVVAGMLRWNDVRIAAQSNFGTRVELRLNDPADSGIDRRLAQTVAPEERGRALTDGKLFAQVALPRIDSRATDADLGDALDSAVRAVRGSWSGVTAPPVRVLPARLPLTGLPNARTEPDRVAIGLDQAAMQPVKLDLFGRDQHLIVFGDSECGKTNLLKLVARGLMERHSDQELVFAVMDPRRGLHSLVPEPYRGGYAHNTRLAAALSAAVATELDKRMPDDTPAPEVFAGPIDLKGPRIVVLVDDYDMLAGAGQQPLGAFVPYLPSAADLGLHFVVARRVSGASRAMYEPFLTTLRESGTAALVMTGHRAEGQLLPGVYPAPRPPGRGTYISRGSANRLIQTGICPEYEDA
ncbi:type VII secretion protein EccCa [Yinghuangia sp. YIM S09857]|uniref:type VII secretion protein EccCa n=1 Tax=Yinghuangia sp. YIM S09857 TaxID=3436929 RepID=UPI003F53C349